MLADLLVIWVYLLQCSANGRRCRAVPSVLLFSGLTVVRGSCQFQHPECERRVCSCFFSYPIYQYHIFETRNISCSNNCLQSGTGILESVADENTAILDEQVLYDSLYPS